MPAKAEKWLKVSDTDSKYSLKGMWLSLNGFKSSVLHQTLLNPTLSSPKIVLTWIDILFVLAGGVGILKQMKLLVINVECSIILLELKFSKYIRLNYKLGAFNFNLKIKKWIFNFFSMFDSEMNQ